MKYSEFEKFQQKKVAITQMNLKVVTHFGSVQQLGKSL